MSEGLSWGATLDEPATPKADTPAAETPAADSAATAPKPSGTGALGAALSGIKKQAEDDVKQVTEQLKQADVATESKDEEGRHPLLCARTRARRT